MRFPKRKSLWDKLWLVLQRLTVASCATVLNAFNSRFTPNEAGNLNCLIVYWTKKYKNWDPRGTRSRPCSFTSLIWCQNVQTRCFTPLPALSLPYNLSSLQDRRWMGRNQHRKWGNHSDVTEPEYDVVEDQEEVLDVRILPARPMHDETEYAGKWGDCQL